MSDNQKKDFSFKMILHWNICHHLHFKKILFENLNLFFILFLLVPYRLSVDGCSISNATHVSDTPNSITLHWDLTPDCLDVESGSFQILARHRKFLACNERINGVETRLVTNQVCRTVFKKKIFISLLLYVQDAIWNIKKLEKKFF